MMSPVKKSEKNFVFSDFFWYNILYNNIKEVYNENYESKASS